VPMSVCPHLPSMALTLRLDDVSPRCRLDTQISKCVAMTKIVLRVWQTGGDPWTVTYEEHDTVEAEG
jgi:hypothetical protein